MNLVLILRIPVDGGQLGELNCETFNACDAKIFIKGRSVHPGSAKGKMINAITLAAEWQMALPGWRASRIY